MTSEDRTVIRGPAAVVPKPRPWYRFVRHLARVTSWVLFSLRAYGRRHVPAAGGALLVSNHQSFLDPILVSVILNRPVNFLARSTLFVGPFGTLLKSLNAVPIDREGVDRVAFKKAVDLLKAGHLVLIFPEGTRSHAGGSLGAFRNGFGVLARRSGVPIVPVAIHESHRAWPRHRWVPLPSPITVLIGPPHAPAAEAETSAAVRRAVAQLLETPPHGLTR